MTHRPNEPKTVAFVELRNLAEQQGGLLHRDQLLASGISPRQIRAWRAAGWLDERLRWTYALPGTPNGLAQRTWAAVLSAGGDAAITATHALALMEIVSARRSPVVLRSDGRPRQQPGLTVRQVGALPDHETTDTLGPRATTFARAMLDAAALPWWEDLDQALDRGVRLEKFDGRALERVLADHPKARGAGPLAAAIAKLDETAGRKRSELERRLVELVVSGGLPTPIVNGIVHGWEVDLHWYLTRAIVEADGRKDHISPADVAKDAAKRAALEDAGYVILLVDWWSVVYQPDATLERIRRFIDANQAPPVPRTLVA